MRIMRIPIAGLTLAALALVLAMSVSIALAATATEKQKFSSSDAAFADVFGHPMAVDGTTAVAVSKFKNGIQGAAYVFERIGGEWVEQQKLTASDGAPFGFFGFSTSVAIQGTTIVIGGNSAKNSSGVRSGAAYVFENVGGTWVETQKLSDDATGVAGDNFGLSTAIHGSTLAIGATGRQVNGADSAGIVYIYERVDSTWVEDTRLT